MVEMVQVYATRTKRVKLRLWVAGSAPWSGVSENIVVGSGSIFDSCVIQGN